MKKWIIAVTLPTGLKMAFSSFDGQFALVPITLEGTFKAAKAWDLKSDAQKYLDAQLEAAPQLKNLGPIELLQCEMLQ